MDERQGPAILLFLASFSLWAIIHSVMASLAFKRRMRGWLGDRAYEGLYRLIYNAVAVVTFAPVIYFLATLIPERRLWQIPAPWHVAVRLAQLLGLAGILASLWQASAGQFAGLSQVIRYLRGEPKPQVEPELVTGGLYAWVRHPLYFFSLLALWASPTMTLGNFLFNAAATLYFWLGSIPEERKLLAEYGEAYQIYQQHTPRLLPLQRHQTNRETI